MEHQFKRSYRTHRSFLPLAVGYIEKKPETLEKFVSFLALKMVISKINPEAVMEQENDIYLQTRVVGMEDIDGFYSYFTKKGLSQSEVTHRLKRVKFLKLINDSVYIIPPLQLVLPVEDKIRTIEIRDDFEVKIQKVEPVVEVKKEPIKTLDEPYVPVIITTSMAQAITEFTKVVTHSGFVEVSRNENGRKFNGMGIGLHLKVLAKEKFRLDIENNNSPEGKIIPYNKNKTSGNYLHITKHTFGAVNYLMTRAEFKYDKQRSSETTKVYTRQDYTIILKWIVDSTHLEFIRHLSYGITERTAYALSKEEQKFLNRIP